MPFLKREGCLIPQRRMATMRIIPPFDILEHIPDRFLPVPVTASVYAFTLERGKETGVVTV
jgi:hypothetical protein